MEVAHPTPAGNLVPYGVVILADGSSAFVEIDRMMSYARLIARLERCDAYRNAPASGRGNVARAPRSHWQETYAGPSTDRPFPLVPVRLCPGPTPRGPGPTPRGPGNEGAAFHERARRVPGGNYRLTVASTTLAQLTRRARSAGVAGGRPRRGPPRPGRAAEGTVSTAGPLSVAAGRLIA
jgi:hypothetical protein